MATYGAIKLRVTDYDELIFDWSRVSVSEINNATTISWRLMLYSTEYGAITSSVAKTWSVHIDGVRYGGQNSIAIGNNETKVLAQGTTTISHEYDGTKTFSIQFSQQFNITFAGEHVGTKSKEAVATLDPIQRRANIISAADFTDEGNPSLTYTPIQGVKQLLCNVSWDGIAYISNRVVSTTNTTFIFSLTDNERKTLREAMANKNTMSVTYTLITVFNDGSTLTSSKTATAKIINAQPTLKATVADKNEQTIDATGNPQMLVRHRSSANVTTTATALKGASIVSVVCKNGTQSKAGTNVIFENVESGTFFVEVTDSRGNRTTEKLTTNLIEYIPLTCNIANAEAGAGGNLSFGVSGDFFNGSFGLIDNQVIVGYRVYEKGATPPQAQFVAPNISGNTYIAYVNVDGLDYQKAYTLEVAAWDEIDTTPFAKTEINVLPIFDWGKNDFQFNVPVNFAAGAQLRGKAIDAGAWTPVLEINEQEATYDVQEGWYQRVGNVVTIGWQIKATIEAGNHTTALGIKGVPFYPTVSAFGGGVAHNIYITGGFCFEGWAISTSKVISARLQPCNNTSAGNLQIASTSYYPTGGGAVTLAGTICFTTNDL